MKVVKKINNFMERESKLKAHFVTGVVSVCGITFITFLLFFPPAFLRVQEVVVQNPLKHLHEMDVIRLADVRKGAPLLTLRLQKIRDNIRRYAWVKEVNLSKRIPGRLVIEVEEQIPVAILELDSLYLVNGDGIIFKKLESEDSKDLPLVTGLVQAKPETLAADVKQLVMLVKLFDVSIKSMDLSEIHREANGELILFTQEPVMKMTLGKGKWEERIQKFAQVWPTIQATAHHPQVIHLEMERRLVVKQIGISKKEVSKDG